MFQKRGRLYKNRIFLIVVFAIPVCSLFIKMDALSGWFCLFIYLAHFSINTKIEIQGQLLLGSVLRDVIWLLGNLWAGISERKGELLGLPSIAVLPFIENVLNNRALQFASLAPCCFLLLLNGKLIWFSTGNVRNCTSSAKHWRGWGRHSLWLWEMKTPAS